MAIQFNRENAAIGAFHSGYANLENQRRQQEAEFQAQGVDAALRRAYQPPIAEFTAQPAAPAAQVQPAPAGPPMPAARATMPDQGMAPEGVSVAATDAASRASGTVPGSTLALAGPGAPPVGAPAAAPTVTNPAGPATAVASARPRAGGYFQRAQGELAKVRGGGQALAQFASADQQQQTAAMKEGHATTAEGLKLFFDASRNHDIGMMRALNQRYGLGIPAEVLNSREGMASIAVAANTAKTLGITDDDKALAFAAGFTHAKSSGMGDNEAVQVGLKMAQQGAGGVGKAVHWAVDDKHQVTGFDAKGQPIRTGVQARALKWEAGGGGGSANPAAGSKQQQYAEWRIKTLVAGGMTEAQAQQIVAGGTASRPVTPQQRATLAKGLMATKDQMGRPIYKTMQDALKAADTALAAPASAPAAAPAAGQPAPGGAPAAQAAVPGPAKAPTMYDPKSGTWSDGK